MALLQTEAVLWASGFLTEAGLTVALVKTQRFKRTPVFSIWIGFNCIRTVLLYLVFREASSRAYFYLYWAAAFADLALQLAVLLENGSAILRTRSRFVKRGYNSEHVWITSALLVAGISAILAHPVTESFVDLVFAKANLFMTILFCALFGILTTASGRLGVWRRDFTLRIAYGLGAWNSASFVVDCLHTYVHAGANFDVIETLRSVAFQVVTVYWIVGSFSKDKDNGSIPQAIATDLKKLHERRQASSSPVFSSEACS